MLQIILMEDILFLKNESNENKGSFFLLSLFGFLRTHQNSQEMSDFHIFSF